MSSIPLIILLAFIRKAHARELAVNQVVDAQDKLSDRLVDNLVDNLVKWRLKAETLHCADLDDTILMKSHPGQMRVTPDAQPTFPVPQFQFFPGLRSLPISHISRLSFYASAHAAHRPAHPSAHPSRLSAHASLHGLTQKLAEVEPVIAEVGSSVAASVAAVVNSSSSSVEGARASAAGIARAAAQIMFAAIAQNVSLKEHDEKSSPSMTLTSISSEELLPTQPPKQTGGLVHDSRHTASQLRDPEPNWISNWISNLTFLGAFSNLTLTQPAGASSQVNDVLGACNTDDQESIEFRGSGSWPTIASTCASSAFNIIQGFDQDKLTTCLMGHVAISTECSACFAKAGQYAYKHCKLTCLKNQWSSPCLQCFAGSDIEKCTGFDVLAPVLQAFD